MRRYQSLIPVTQTRAASVDAGRKLSVAAFIMASLAGLGSVAGDRSAEMKAREGMVARQRLEVVDCLLPGEVRRVGGATYITRQRPTRTTAGDCRSRGGDYVEYDRADYRSALRVWMVSANLGDAEAMTNVGEIYERGLGGEPNYAAALIWYRKVVDDQTIPEKAKLRALFNLGTLYELGQGVEKDQLMALNYYRRAWGIPEDSVMYKAARDREVDALRAQLDQAIADKDGQIAVMKKQVSDLQNRSSADAQTMQHVLDSLQGEVDKLNAERRREDQTPPAAPTDPRLRGGRTPLPWKKSDGKPDSSKFGRYFALIIGDQDYEQLENLRTPRHDAEQVAGVLKDKYGFTVQIVEDADDLTIMSAFNDLNKVLKPDDNLLIYYAGHGYRFNQGMRESGYWLPRNAFAPPDDTAWISTGEITDQIARLGAKRILVVADSCYSGLLSTDPSLHFLKPTDVSDDYIAYMLPNRSRLLIASGGDNPVLDEGGDGNSVFARAFLDVLANNRSILTAPLLYSLVEEKVREIAARNHFSQKPEFKAIKQAGHEVGDFFLVPVSAGL